MPLICFSVASIAKTHSLLQAVRLQLEDNRDTDGRETIGKLTPECTLNTVHGAQSGGGVRGGTLAENRPTQLRWWRRRCDLLPFPKMLRCRGDGQQSAAVSVVGRAWCILKRTCSRTAQYLPVAPPLVRLFFREHVPSCLVCFSCDSIICPSVEKTLRCSTKFQQIASSFVECSHDDVSKIRGLLADTMSFPAHTSADTTRVAQHN